MRRKQSFFFLSSYLAPMEKYPRHHCLHTLLATSSHPKKYKIRTNEHVCDHTFTPLGEDWGVVKVERKTVDRWIGYFLMEQSTTTAKTAAFRRIRDILVRVRIPYMYHRITGIRILLFSSVTFICFLLTIGTFTSVFKDNKPLRSPQNCRIKVFLNFFACW